MNGGVHIVAEAEIDRLVAWFHEGIARFRATNPDAIIGFADELIGLYHAKLEKGLGNAKDEMFVPGAKLDAEVRETMRLALGVIGLASVMDRLRESQKLEAELAGTTHKPSAKNDQRRPDTS